MRASVLALPENRFAIKLLGTWSLHSPHQNAADIPLARHSTHGTISLAEQESAGMSV
jgi:hypothetical protein